MCLTLFGLLSFHAHRRNQIKLVVRFATKRKHSTPYSFLLTQQFWILKYHVNNVIFQMQFV